MGKAFALWALLLTVAACGPKPAERLANLSDEFVYTTLSFSPAAAAGAGLHEYKGQKLDDLLDDIGSRGLERQRLFYRRFRQQLTAIPPEKLDAQGKADLAILQDQTELALLDLDEIHSHLHNPTIYVETLGNALFTPYVLDYAPKAQRIQNIINRLGKVPLFLDEASVNLTSAPAVWTRVAMDENLGNIDLVNNAIRADVPPGAARCLFRRRQTGARGDA